jgi:hypothetical protein
MPCAIILRDNIYDTIIETENLEKLEGLYRIALNLDAAPAGEVHAPWNKKVFEITGELWITSTTAILKDESTFREKFPSRRVPMRLTLRQAEKTKWYHGIIYEGMRYFQKQALSEDSSLAPMSEFPKSIFVCPRKSEIEVPPNYNSHQTELFLDKALLDHYMFITELRMERKQNQL